MSAFPHEQESAALDQASCKAINLVRQFAEQDPNDISTENPWLNPTRMFEELDVARLQVLQAAETLKQAVSQGDSDICELPAYDEDYLRAQFMDMITDAFSDVLTSMKGQEVDVDVLADCLQSGMDLLSQEDRDFFLQDIDDDSPAEKEKLTPHEARRRKLGFVHTTA